MDILLKIKRFSVLAGLIWMISCKGSKNAEVIAHSEQILYAGTIQACLSIPGHQFVPYSVENGEIYYMDDGWFVKPFYPGELNLNYRLLGTSRLHKLKFKVVQYSMPLFFLGPPPYIHGPRNEVQWYVSIVDTIGTRLKNNGSMMGRYPFRAESFTLKLFDQKDSLIFEGTNYDYRFSIENEELAKSNLKYGHKILIENIKFSFPDGSSGIGKMDTLVYEKN